MWRWAPYGYIKFWLLVSAYWVLVNVLPWDYIYHLPGYPSFVAFMAKIMPLIEGLQSELRYGGLEYSKAQLSFIAFCGIVWGIYAPLVTKRPHPIPQPPRWFALFGAIPLGLVMTGIPLALLLFVDEVREPLQMATEYNTEAQWTALIIGGWMAPGFFLSVVAGISKALVFELKQKFSGGG